MLVEVVVAVEHITLRLKRRIAPRAPGFLDIVLQRIGDVVVDDKADVLLVHTHAKSRRCDNDLHFVANESVLVFNLFGGLHLPVERQCRDTVVRQFLRKLPCPLRTRHIHYGGTVLLLDQHAQRRVLLGIRLLVKHGIMQILARGSRSVDGKLYADLATEIVADVADDLLLCRGSETRHGNRRRQRFRLLELPDEVPNVQVVHAEIMSPCRETVRFVYDKANDVAAQQNAFHRLRPQLLRRNVEEIGRSVGNAPERIGAFDRIEQPVDSDGRRQPLGLKVVNLVLHEGLERRDHDRQAVHEFAGHQRGQLERDRLATASREHGDERLPPHGRACRVLLQRLARIRPERVESEKPLEAPVHIKPLPAVRTPLAARRVAEVVDDVLNPRIRLHDPEWSNRIGSRRPDKREGVCKLGRIPPDDRPDVGVAAYPVAELASDRVLDRTIKRHRTVQRKKTVELRDAAKQARIDPARKRIKREKCGNLIVVEALRLLRIADRIVQFVLLELVVL